MTPSNEPVAAADAPQAPQPGWLETFKVYTELPTLRMLTLGFSAGLPLLLVLGTLSFGCARRVSTAPPLAI